MENYQVILEGSVEGKRDKGQQRRKWDDDVKNWSGITRFGDVKRKSEDRLVWKKNGCQPSH